MCYFTGAEGLITSKPVENMKEVDTKIMVYKRWLIWKLQHKAEQNHVYILLNKLK